MDYLFESERLGFRQWNELDRLPFFEMCSDPRVMEYFPSHLSASECEAFITRLQNDIKQNKHGFYAVDLLESGKFIGFIGVIFQTMETTFTPCYEIGWRLNCATWNQGLATEGAKACLNHIFANFDCEEIYSITPVQNAKSERVMQKIGMRHYGYFNHPKLTKDSPLSYHTIYRIEKTKHSI